MLENKSTKILFEKGFISDAQFNKINEYRSNGLFSLRNELRILFVISVLLFTSGASIIIYNNIDNIGHIAVLSTIFIVMIGCFYYGFVNSKGYSNNKVVSLNHINDYIVLTANILAGIFVGYLQYQYKFFGGYYQVPTLLLTIVYFFNAYYFDHAGVLSLAISGLFAFMGFSVVPSDIFDRAWDYESTITFYMILTGVLLIVWAAFAEIKGFKKHFNDMYQNFALNIIAISAISNFFEPNWILCFILLMAAIYYFIKISYYLNSAKLFFFSMIYGFVGLYCSLIKISMILAITYLMIYISPFLIGAFIIYVRKFLKRFKIKAIDNDSVR